MEEKTSAPSSSQAETAELSKAAADLLENEVGIYDKCESESKFYTVSYSTARNY